VALQVTQLSPNGGGHECTAGDDCAHGYHEILEGFILQYVANDTHLLRFEYGARILMHG
jgi:hypothetical protein